METINELNREELLSINGGEGILEDVWYGLGYAAGYVAGRIVKAVNSASTPRPSGYSSSSGIAWPQY